MRLTIYSFWEKIESAKNIFYSEKTYYEVEEIIKKENPDVCHIHNWIPLISPSVLQVCKNHKIPIVQTLHNYRYLCPKINYYRDGHICQDCTNGSNYFPAIKHKCYRNSFTQSYLLSKLLTNNMDKIKNDVSFFICPSNFVKEEYEKNGFPSSKLIIKPNFLAEDPGAGEEFEDYFLFVGRFEETKGSRVINSAFAKLPSEKLIVLGEKLSSDENPENIMFKNFISSRQKVYDYYKNACAVIFPSVTFEVMPMTIIEAFACGKPVIASRLGAMEEMIEDGKTGLLFEPGNPNDLSEKINWAVNHPIEIRDMSKNARKEFLKKYTSDNNFNRLMEIYKFANEKNET